MRGILLPLLLVCALLLPASITQAGVRSAKIEALPSLSQVGKASFYHPALDGRPTASGATFDSHLLTAAHRTLQFGTRVRVTNLVNLKSVIVTINDRGPFVDGRIIDLTRRAAAALGFVQDGITRVRIEPLSVASAL
jgi:rare lipoprotein A